MTKRSRGLYYFSLILAGCTLALLVAGGLVTSHDAGLAVPDWPLSYGQWFPPMVGNVFWEHGHRMIAGTVGLLTLALAVSIQIWEPRKRLKKMALIALAAVVIQALLGGLTVVTLLPPPVSIAHAVLAQTFFCLVIALAFFLCPFQAEVSLARQAQQVSFRRLMLLTSSWVYLQLVLGATVRHTGYGIIPHVIVAFLVLIHVLFVVLRSSNFSEDEASFKRLAVILGLLTLVQIFLGFGAFIFTQVLEAGYSPPKSEVFFTVAHQSTGALILGLSVLLNLKISFDQERAGFRK
ncbi:MAG: COX15/CtaA family protein [Candidatus Omnitrophota bacterium]|nr:COX15/CtaA family protein [Candidatus Omnitrophota bacterium]